MDTAIQGKIDKWLEGNYDVTWNLVRVACVALWA